jgi:aspartate dehydrogenase
MRVAIAGLGAVGCALAQQLDQGAVPGVLCVAASAGRQDKARAFLETLAHPVTLLDSGALSLHADLLIECAPAAHLAEVVTPFLQHGKSVIVLSVGALLQRPDLLELARQTSTSIHVPSGAVLGLDALLAAAEGEIESVLLSSRKPPKGLMGAPYLKDNGIELDGLTQPLRVFKGSAIDAVKGFPANVNVVAALALAGIGAARTQVELWADPGIARNIHHLEVRSDCANFSMTIENIPSSNPKTSRIVVQSVLAMLRKLTSNLRVGT